MTGRYVLWFLPAALMAVAAAAALSIWGTPVPGEDDGVFADFEFEGLSAGDQSHLTSDRPGLPISIKMDEATFKLMYRRENRELYKDRTTNVSVRFGESAEVRRHGILTLRGRGSLRKSTSPPNYDLKLIRPVSLASDVEIRRLFLMNLHFDPHHMEMAVAYRLLAELGLFPLHFQFVRLEVAGQNHGIFLLVEPPVSGLRRSQPDCVGVFRRTRPNGFDVEWTESVPRVRASLDHLRTLVRRQTRQVDGRTLDDSLDLSMYFRWLTVNALLSNIDTLDELFLYECRPGTSRAPLRVLAWDYDDIVDSELKEGALNDPLLYGCLDPLERMIAADPDLFSRYRQTLRDVLTRELTVDHVIAVIRNVQALRDGLDDGTSAENQRLTRMDRAEYADRMVRHVQETHAQLIAPAK